MGATIQQIAEIAGVSRGTVDRALNHRGRISPQVEQRILEIAEKCGYVKKCGNKTTTAVKSRKKIIGIITQLSASPFMDEVNRGIADACRELKARNIEVLVRACQSVDEREQAAAIDELLLLGMEALALMPADSNLIRDKINELIERYEIPVVTFNSDIVGTKRSCYIGLDNRRSGQTAAGLMAAMTGKKGQILIITGYLTNSVSSKRVDGFIETMKDDFPKMELAAVQTSFDRADEVEKIIVNTMRSFPELSGIFLASSGQAGVGKAFLKLGIKRRPYVIIYDMTPDNKEALLDDTVDFLIDQEGYAQGYRPALLLAESIAEQKGQIAEGEIFTEINIKNRYNI